MTDFDYYMEGRAAYMNSLSFADCPYHDSQAADMWHDGYAAARRQARSILDELF